MEKPYRRYALLSVHDGSKYPGVNSILTYGVITLDMSKVGRAPLCDFRNAIIMGLAETPDEVKNNLEEILMAAHGSLMGMLGDNDIDLGEVILVDMPLGTLASCAQEKLVEKFYYGMLEELKI